MSILNFFILCGLWIGYFVIHSFLAAEISKSWFKSTFRNAGHIYRISYNIIASILLIPMLYYIYFVPSKDIIEWSGVYLFIGNAAALIAFSGFIYSLKFYRGMDFFGINQFRHKTTTETGLFVISPLHRFVRHPWYLFALIIIWTRDMNVHFLLSACLMTAYFFIGSHFEERKLISHFGNRYREYITKVPRIFPSYRRYLTAAQATNLIGKD